VLQEWPCFLLNNRLMDVEELIGRNLTGEFIFAASRSGGPGGQNVNKVSTKVELRFNIANTSKFSDTEKGIIITSLSKRINKNGELRIVSQSERSQLMNKQRVIREFYRLVSKALTLPEHRTATKPTFASKEKKFKVKKIRSSVKKLRKDVGDAE
jgi:ribosome-associated protein